MSVRGGLNATVAATTTTAASTPTATTIAASTPTTAMSRLKMIISLLSIKSN